ncbi:tyrosine-type recombinase/integrase [Brevundimonas sp. SL161]|uniref:tyrosine-type recombinase/integrase n=1 Tax=Brevundimonas sp. SL161 TaxID=2804613 RepID=UPI003CEEF574
MSDYLIGKAEPFRPDAERLTSPADVLVADAIALYAADRSPHLADPVSSGIRLAALLEFFGTSTLASVNRTNCQAYLAHRISQPIKSFKNPETARRVSEQAVIRELEDLSAVIGWWDAEHRLTRPIKVWRPAKPDSPRDALTRKEAAHLLKAARGNRLVHGRWKTLPPSSRSNRRHLSRMLLLGLYTGTRPGVLTRLRWHPSDTEPWIDLEGGWMRRRGRLERDQPTKRRPICRLPRRLHAHLVRWHALDEAESRDRARRGLPSIKTVIHHGGRPLAGRIRRSFASAVRDAGLSEQTTPHWLRHTAATWLVANPKVELSEAAQYLGMTVETLVKHYNHHRPDFLAAASKALSQPSTAAHRSSPH